MPPENVPKKVTRLRVLALSSCSVPARASICDPTGIWRAVVSDTNPFPLTGAALARACGHGANDVKALAPAAEDSGPPASAATDVPGGGLMNTCPETGLTST